ncbi:uncharacterized protein THITE_75172 [Thermothielavioides terrestris NRRL 8126]|uniref:Uncharacterized protein n=1 Tax=Thermothielavioides terrestris (strain ATCC 38088 / NRRL 8126) TaxID=578455 RepID=G2RHC0_THETT|nr:uncharacterized protein THITE_75172 [Thermothielavioides terrestris NRRL 8126]AEO71232.1 hypothetical protein THITE_75172 [Thermothielavioides terrestris NRRL 8126]
MATTTTGPPESSAAKVADARPENVLDDASSVDDGVHEKQDAPVGASKWQKVKQHFRRFWWAHLIAVIILLAILLPIIFKVIIPAIIRNVVKSQELPVISGALNFTAPTHLNMSMDTSLDTPLGVKIDPLALSLYQPPADPDHDDSDAKGPFLTLQMPEQHVHHLTNVSIPEQTVQVLNQTQITAWFNQFFDNETVDLRLKADQLSAHLGALHYDVSLDKTVKVPGLNYLAGFGVQDMQFTIPPDPATGYNLRGHLLIPNAGVITLGLGNVSFNILAGDVNLGLVHLYDLDLRPGNNTPYFEGEFYFDQLVPNLAAVLASQQAALADGVVELHSRGNATVNYGRHIPYIEGVLNIKRIPMRIPLTSLLLDVVEGVLAGGMNGTQHLPLLDTLGEVLGNKTLFEQMLSHWDAAGGGGNGTAAGGAAGGKRSVMRAVGRSMRMNLFKLGLRSLRSKF